MRHATARVALIVVVCALALASATHAQRGYGQRSFREGSFPPQFPPDDFADDGAHRVACFHAGPLFDDGQLGRLFVGEDGPFRRSTFVVLGDCLEAHDAGRCISGDAPLGGP